MTTDHQPQPDEPHSHKQEWILKNSLYILTTSAFLIVSFYVWTFHTFPINQKPESWGSFGDLIGGLLNPLISGFTLLVALNVWRLQRAELTLTRQELIKQSNTSDIQRKEQRFFDCMALYQRSLDSQSVKTQSSNSYSERITGKDALFTLANRALQSGEVNFFITPATTRGNDNSTKSNTISLVEMRDKLKTKRKRIGLSKTDAYCRCVFELLQVIVDILGSSAPRYVGIFREQLAEEELCLLALYLLFTDHGDQYFELVAQTHLFQNLDTEGIEQLAREHLPQEAFNSPTQRVETC